MTTGTSQNTAVVRLRGQAPWALGLATFRVQPLESTSTYLRSVLGEDAKVRNGHGRRKTSSRRTFAPCVNFQLRRSRRRRRLGRAWLRRTPVVVARHAPAAPAPAATHSVCAWRRLAVSPSGAIRTCVAHPVEPAAAERARVTGPLRFRAGRTAHHRAWGSLRLRSSEDSLSMHDAVGTLSAVRVLSVIHGPTGAVGALRRRDPPRRGTSSSSGRSAPAPQPGGDVRRRARARRPPERRRGGRSTRGSRTSTSSSATSSPTRRRCFAICLGAQTLAHAFGGRVAKLRRAAGRLRRGVADRRGPRDPVLGVLPPRFEALVGNGYGFELPGRGGASSPTSEIQPQAFRLGERAWAVQFHPEARREQVLDWFADDDRVGTLPRPLDELERELEAKIDGWHRLGRGALPGVPRAGGQPSGRQPRALEHGPPAGRSRRRLRPRGRSAARSAAVAGRTARATAAAASSRASRPSAASRR